MAGWKIEIGDLLNIRYIVVFWIAGYEPEHKIQKFKMVDEKWRTKILRSANLLEIRYISVFRTPDYESELKIQKLEIAHPKWRTEKNWNRSTCFAVGTWGFSGPLVSNWNTKPKIFIIMGKLNMADPTWRTENFKISLFTRNWVVECS